MSKKAENESRRDAALRLQQRMIAKSESKLARELARIEAKKAARVAESVRAQAVRKARGIRP